MYKIFNLKGNHYLYNPFEQTIREIPLKVYRNLEQYSREKRKKYLEEIGIIDVALPNQFEIDFPYTEDEIRYILQHRIKGITLAVTEKCNLRCEYCGYMNKYLDKDYVLMNMTTDIAFKSIDFLMQNSSGQTDLYVSFYGGEPLINFDLIKACVEYCYKVYPFRIPTFTIVTNGILLNRKEITKFLVENNFMVNVSLDGPQNVQNMFRKKKSGNDSYSEVITGLQLLYRLGGAKFFREKVTLQTVYIPGSITKETYDFFDNICTDHIVQLKLGETDYFKEYMKKSKPPFLQKEKVDITRYQFAYQPIIDEKLKYFKAFSKPIFAKKILPSKFCVPGTRNNFVTTNGSMIICFKADETKEIFCLGDVWEGINWGKVSYLLSLTKQKLKKCKSCWAVRFCSICFCDIISLDENFCDKMRENIEKNIKYYLIHILKDKRIQNLL